MKIKALTWIGAIAIASSGATHAAGESAAGMQYKEVSRVIAAKEDYSSPQRGGFQWGRDNQSAPAPTKKWADTTDPSSSYSWGSKSSDAIDSEHSSVAEATNAATAIQTGYRWGIRNDADQAGYRWGIRNDADQAGYRWGIRNDADQAGYRWGIRNDADQAGYRWGIR